MKPTEPYDPSKVRVSTSLTIPMELQSKGHPTVPDPTKITIRGIEGLQVKDLVIADLGLDWTVMPPPLPEVQDTPRQYTPPKVTPRAPSKTDVEGIISDAAHYFESGGTWCQNSLGNDDQICLVGSLLRAETGDPNDVYNPTQPYRHPLTTAAVNKLSELLSNKGVRAPRSRDPDSNPNFDRVSHWNDTKGRTKAEVIQLLKEATKK